MQIKESKNNDYIYSHISQSLTLLLCCRTYVLEATSEEECESWMEAITKAIQTSEEADKK